MIPRDVALLVAIESVLEHEGGWTPIDGGTQRGVTQRAWNHFRKYYGLRPSPVRDTTREQTVGFYRWYLTTNRWQDVRVIEPLVPMVLFGHMLVIHGHRAGARVFQDAVIRATKRAIAVDGMIGNETLEAMKLVAPMDLVKHLEAAWCDKFDRICAANPEKRQYRNGWIKRATGWSGGWKP